METPARPEPPVFPVEMLQEPRVADAVARPGAGDLHVAAPARLALHGICKTWGRASTPVLQDVDLEISRGTIVAVVGHNGAGKTTLLRIAAGLIAADGGTVSVDGLDPFADRREYQRLLGFVSAGTGGGYARLTVPPQLGIRARLAFVPP